jgi:hypothetical protein
MRKLKPFRRILIEFLNRPNLAINNPIELRWIRSKEPSMRKEHGE